MVVLNDVDAGVYGEYRFGAAEVRATALGIFPGTGIGGGCVYDGDILRGKRNSCMEIGHISVTPGRAALRLRPARLSRDRSQSPGDCGGSRQGRVIAAKHLRS